MGDCLIYGQTSGCDINCPILWDGECEVIEEVLEIIDEDERKKKLIEIYFPWMKNYSLQPL